jgi:hypothetical protein
MRSAVFSYVPRICTDFIQDKNVVDCLACSLSLVQHSRYCIFLFDEIINYGAAYSMGSLTGGRITIGTTYIRREAHIYFDSYTCFHLAKDYRHG